MSEQNQGAAEPQKMVPDGLNRPAYWGETLLALGPFLLLPLIFLLGRILRFPDLSNIIGSVLFLAVIAIFLITLIVAWVKCFPRWSFPYWGFVLTITLYFASFRGTVFGLPFMGTWVVWLPVMGVAAIGLIWRRDLLPPYRLIGMIWMDWTLLSFTFYGALPLMYIAAYDEVHNAKLIQSAVLLILAGGALFYMRSSTIWQRFAYLVSGFVLSWAVTMIYQGIYWNGRQELGMGAPGTWAGTLNWTGRLGIRWTVYLLAPLLLGVLHLVVRSMNRPKTA